MQSLVTTKVVGLVSAAVPLYFSLSAQPALLLFLFQVLESCIESAQQ